MKLDRKEAEIAELKARSEKAGLQVEELKKTDDFFRCGKMF